MTDFINNQISSTTAVNARTKGFENLQRRIKGDMNDPSVKKAKETAQEFEAMMLGQLFGHMFTDIETDGPFGGGHAEGIYRSFMVEEYGKIASKSGGFGLSDQIERYMIDMQAKTMNPEENITPTGEE